MGRRDPLEAIAGDMTSYVGKWVTIVNGRIVATSDSAEVFKEARRKYPRQEIFIMKVPTAEPTLL